MEYFGNATVKPDFQMKKISVTAGTLLVQFDILAPGTDGLVKTVTKYLAKIYFIQYLCYLWHHGVFS